MLPVDCGFVIIGGESDESLRRPLHTGATDLGQEGLRLRRHVGQVHRRRDRRRADIDAAAGHREWPSAGRLMLMRGRWKVRVQLRSARAIGSAATASADTTNSAFMA